MTNVDIEVIFKIGNHVIRDTQFDVRLNDDSVQVAAAGLAYGLVEEAWGLVDDE